MLNYSRKKIIVYLGLALTLGNLVLLAYQGIYNRFWADDWCYNADILHKGLIGAIQGYYTTTTYSTNRFSLTLFSGLMVPLGIPGVQLLPLGVILLWMGGLYWDVRWLGLFFKFTIDRLTSLLAAVLALNVTLWLAPNQFQILLFRSAVLPYTAPLIGLTWLAGIILRQAINEGPTWPGLVEAGLLAFLVGGFSEIACALLLAGLGLALFLTLIKVIFQSRQSYDHSPWLNSASNRVVVILSLALIGALAAMMALLLSPMNVLRDLASYGPPATLTAVPLMALKYSYYYIRAFLSLNRWAVLALGASGLVLGIATSGYQISLRRLLSSLVGMGLVIYLLVAAVHVPTAYIENARLGEERAMIVPAFVMVVGMLAGSWIVGIAVRNWRPGWVEKPRIWMVGLMLFLALAPIAFVASKYSAALAPIPFFQERALAWDERDATIRQAKAAGQMVVDVHAIDSYAGVMELYPQPNWINTCAASYYGVHQIRATLPWNP